MQTVLYHFLCSGTSWHQHHCAFCFSILAVHPPSAAAWLGQSGSFCILATCVKSSTIMKGHVVHFVETDFVPANSSLKYFKAYLKLQFTRRLLGKDKPHFQALYRAENRAFLLPKASLKYYTVPVSGYPNTQLYSHFGLQSVPSQSWALSVQSKSQKNPSVPCLHFRSAPNETTRKHS